MTFALWVLAHGFTVAGVLFTLAILALLWIARDGFRASTDKPAGLDAVLSGQVPLPDQPPADAATVLIPRVTDHPDATAVLPRVDGAQ